MFIFVMWNLGEWVSVWASCLWTYLPRLVSGLKILVKRLRLLDRQDVFNRVTWVKRSWDLFITIHQFVLDSVHKYKMYPGNNLWNALENRADFLISPIDHLCQMSEEMYIHIWSCFIESHVDICWLSVHHLWPDDLVKVITVTRFTSPLNVSIIENESENIDDAVWVIRLS